MEQTSRRTHVNNKLLIGKKEQTRVRVAGREISRRHAAGALRMCTLVVRHISDRLIVIVRPFGGARQLVRVAKVI